MNDQEKTKVELTNELQELQKKLNSLEELYNKDIARHLQTEEKLRESEERLRSIFENTDAGYFFIDKDGFIKDVNQAWVRLYGYDSADEIIGHHFLEIQQIDDIESAKEFVNGILRNESAFLKGEFSRKLKDGSKGFHSFSARNVKHLGEITGIEGFIIDTTERRMAEEKLLFIKTAVESTSDAIGISDAHGHHFFQNKALTDLFGYETAEEMEKAGGGPIAVKDPEVAKEMFHNIMHGRSWTGELEMVTKSDHVFPAYERADAIKDGDGNIIGLIGIISDITERKKIEASLKASEEKFRSIAENLSDVIYLTDDKGIITYISPAALTIFGYIADEMTGHSFSDYLGDEEKQRLVPIFRNAVHTGISIKNLPVTPVRKDGKNFFGEVSSIMIIKDGIVNGTMGLIRDVTGQKRKEDELRKLNKAVESAVEVVFMTDKEGLITYVNPAFTAVYGYETGEVVGITTPRILKSGQMEDSRYQYFWHELLKNQVVTGELINKTKDGRFIHMDSSTSTILNELGEITGFLAIQRDITDRQQAEAKIRASYQFNKSMLQTIPFGMDVVDANGNILFLNEHLKQYIGEEGLGEKCWELYRDDKKQCSDCPLHSGIKIGETNRYETCGVFGGKIFQIFHTGMIFKGQEAMLEIFTDITERKLAEAELQKERLLLRSVINNLPDSIYTKDLNCRKTLVNLTELRYSGVKTESEVIGKDDFDIFPKELAEKFYADDQTVMQSGLSLINKEEFIPDENQQKRWMLTSKIPLRGTDNQIIGLLGIGKDITEIKQAEVELIRAKEKAEESDRLKSAFLANMSHEIRTPMNGILGFAELLKESRLTGEEQQEYISIIEKSGVRMLNIINDIVDISKIESGQMKVDNKESNINEQIEYIYTFFKPEVEGKGIQLFFKNTLPSIESIIKTDREKVFAILTNLVKNAIKYSEKGTIEFGYNLVETHGSASLMQFFVKDQGIGIPKERQEAIFERFIQADFGDKRAFQGAGLGLAIAKTYVDMLGGKIWVESEEGVGSTFYFTLPYNSVSNEEAANEKIVPSDEAATLDRKLTILIAEDDEFSERLMSIAVKPMSKEVLIARTGLEAVEVCRNNTDIDLVLMDIQMPEMNGYEATGQVRQFNKDIIIIAQTAFGLSGDREKAIDAGCNDYISKPIDLTVLKGLIQKYFYN